MAPHYKINFLGKPVFTTRYKILENNIYALSKKSSYNNCFLIISNSYLKNTQKKNYYTAGYKIKQNYNKSRPVAIYKKPYYIFMKNMSIDRKNELGLKNLITINKQISNSYLGVLYEIEIIGYSRRVCFNTKTKQLFLRLGSSYVNIKNINKRVFIKIIKMRLLLFYSLNTTKLKTFITQLIKLKPTSAYKKSGVVFLHSKLDLKKKRAKVF